MCSINNDVDFRKALENSDILLPDGIGIVWAEKVFKWTKALKKIAGYDLFLFHLMNKLNNLKTDPLFF